MYDTYFDCLTFGEVNLAWKHIARISSFCAFGSSLDELGRMAMCEFDDKMWCWSMDARLETTEAEGRWVSGSCNKHVCTNQSKI